MALRKHELLLPLLLSLLCTYEGSVKDAFLLNFPASDFDLFGFSADAMPCSVSC